MLTYETLLPRVMHNPYTIAPHTIAHLIAEGIAPNTIDRIDVTLCNHPIAMLYPNGAVYTLAGYPAGRFITINRINNLLPVGYKIVQRNRRACLMCDTTLILLIVRDYQWLYFKNGEYT